MACCLSIPILLGTSITSSFVLSSSVSSILLQSLEINSPGESGQVKHTVMIVMVHARAESYLMKSPSVVDARST